ncbi:MAG: hypothetical protein Q7S74_00750 [Nanoarchaeota archaeon]|nr:hypothetical protein [Nanoarchaeota archaeon]
MVYQNRASITKVFREEYKKEYDEYPNTEVNENTYIFRDLHLDIPLGRLGAITLVEAVADRFNIPRANITNKLKNRDYKFGEILDIFQEA